VRDHPRGRRFAVRSGNRHDWNPRAFAIRIQRVDDGGADVAARPGGRKQVHPQTRRRVHLDDAAAGLRERRRDVVGDEVDAADVEPDQTCGALTRRPHLVVHAVGDVFGRAAGRQIRGAAQQHLPALLRTIVGGERLLPQAALGDVVQRQPGQRPVVAVATRRIGIDHIDEFANGAAAVANHVRRRAQRGGDEAAAHDQRTIVAAAEELLDDNLGGALPCARKGEAHRSLVVDADGDAAALVAVEGFDHDRAADPTCTRRPPRPGPKRRRRVEPG